MSHQDTGSPGRPVTSGLQVLGEPEHCRTRTRPLGDLPAALSFEMYSTCTSRDE